MRLRRLSGRSITAIWLATCRHISVVFGSTRGRNGLLTNGLSSLGNLSLTLSIARLSGLTTLGQFALAFSLYVLAQALVQSGVSESVLGAVKSTERRQNAGHEVSLIGLVGGASLVVAGLVFGSSYVTILGFAIHGLLVYDFIKVTNLGLLKSHVALRQELVWTFVTLVGVGLGIAGVFGAEGIFAWWAISGALIGYVDAAVLKIAVRPRWPSNRSDTRVTALFALDQLLGPGTVFLSTYLLAGFAGLAVVGAIRAAATFFGPLSLITSTTRAIAIPFLARCRELGPASEFRMAMRFAMIPTLVVGPVAMVLAFLPGAVYDVLLGASATAVRPLLLPLALDCLVNFLSTMPFSGLRAHQAAGHTVVVFLLASPLRLALILGGAGIGGAAGAAWATLLSTTFTTLSMWYAYRRVVFATRSTGTPATA